MIIRLRKVPLRNMNNCVYEYVSMKNIIDKHVLSHIFVGRFMMNNDSTVPGMQADMVTNTDLKGNFSPIRRDACICDMIIRHISHISHTSADPMAPYFPTRQKFNIMEIIAMVMQLYSIYLSLLRGVIICNNIICSYPIRKTNGISILIGIIACV